MKKFFIWLGILSLGLIFQTIFLVPSARAASCKCYETNNDGSYSNNIKIDGVYCKETSTDKCFIDQFKDESGNVIKAIDCRETYRSVDKEGTPERKCYSRVCQPYLDNKCEKAFGEDKSASVNKCWTEEECNNAGGLFDKDGKKSPNCKPSGTNQTARCFVKPPKIKLQVPIPGLAQEFEGGFPVYLADFYKFFVGFMTVVAVVMIMWGGFKRIMAAGSSESIKNANGTVFAAIIGLVLTLVSYTLLNLINPKLVELTGLDLDKIRTEQFGTWCPEKDPETGTIIKCGYITKIKDNQCVGKVCLFEGKGCYKMSNNKEVDVNGKSKGYECLTQSEACKMVTKDNIEELSGISTSDFGATSGDTLYYPLNNVCQKYAKDGIDCLWVHEAVKGDHCEIYPEATKVTRCYKSDGTLKTCNDFNHYSPWNGIFYQVTAGDDFAACAYNFCGSVGLNCKTVPMDSSGLSIINVLSLKLGDVINTEYSCVNK